jgi:hypothetical protein
MRRARSWSVSQSLNWTSLGSLTAGNTKLLDDGAISVRPSPLQAVVWDW